LKNLGADTANVKRLFVNDFDSYKKKFQLIATSKIYKSCAIAATDILDPEMKIIAPQTADEILCMRDIKASFVLYRSKENEVSICARSFGDLNVQIIMEKLGGGGHQTMAGVQLQSISAIDTVTKLLDAINEYQSDKSTVIA
jgi:c-di-AMP phosphodiesterase-like protein